MSGKNHKRYKFRKQINKVKHEPKKLFIEPPIFIHDWEELSKAESETHYLEIDIEGGNGHVRPKVKIDDNAPDYYDHNFYLSTHTFYGSQYSYVTNKLRMLGFNIQLKNWDGETVYCRQ